MQLLTCFLMRCLIFCLGNGIFRFFLGDFSSCSGSALAEGLSSPRMRTFDGF